MFTTPCLIRKNTENIRRVLSELGYKIAPKQYMKERPRGILCRPNSAIGVPNDSYEYNLDEYLNNNRQIMDCGTNEDLFLAIAALRDDTDKNQWFVHNNNSDLFYFCDKDEFHLFSINPDDALDFYDDKVNWHKATVEELIEHFKDK